MNSRPSPQRIGREYPYFPLMVVIHGSSALMDSAVAVTLASSALFTVDVHQARMTILFSLVGTLLPFILLAPSASLLVEKIRSSRIVVAMCINAMRCVGLILMGMAASESSSARLAIFPLAFIMLTLSKCYVVAKTSALPQITSVEKFPFFSSRLSMIAGVISLIAGTLFFAMNNVFSETASLYSAAVLGLSALAISALSYLSLHKRYTLDDAVLLPEEEATLHIAEMPVNKRMRAIKSLFTYSCAIRFAVGAVTIGIGLKFRTDELMLALCFLSAATVSFFTNAVAVRISRSRIAPVINYVMLGGVVFVSVLLIVRSTSLSYIILSGLLGGVSAYVRVVYEWRAAHIIPLEYSARLLARGEVWMQLSWVVGAACAVLSYGSFTIAMLCILATFLSAWAYRSNATALNVSSD